METVFVEMCNMLNIQKSVMSQAYLELFGHYDYNTLFYSLWSSLKTSLTNQI